MDNKCTSNKQRQTKQMDRMDPSTNKPIGFSPFITNYSWCDSSLYMSCFILLLPSTDPILNSKLSERLSVVFMIEKNSIYQAAAGLFQCIFSAVFSYVLQCTFYNVFYYYIELFGLMFDLWCNFERLSQLIPHVSILFIDLKCLNHSYCFSIYIEDRK